MFDWSVAVYDFQHAMYAKQNADAPIASSTSFVVDELMEIDMDKLKAEVKEVSDRVLLDASFTIFLEGKQDFTVCVTVAFCNCDVLALLKRSISPYTHTRLSSVLCPFEL